MSKDQAETIRSAMAGFQLPESAIPSWASQLSDEELQKMLQDKLFEKTKGKGNIDILWSHTLKEILGDESGVNGILLNDLNNEGKDVALSVEGVFIAIGHNPNTEIFNNQIQLD